MGKEGGTMLKSGLVLLILFVISLVLGRRGRPVT